MRHYHDVVRTSVFNTVIVNGGEYTHGIDPDRFLNEDNPFKALCEALEIGLSDALSFVSTGDSKVLAPNECRVLEDFVNFHRSVCAAWGSVKKVLVGSSEMAVSSYDETFKQVFIYTNLNEGKSVVWYVDLTG